MPVFEKTTNQTALQLPTKSDLPIVTHPGQRFPNGFPAILNPLETIGRVLGEILHHQEQIKCLEVRQQEISAEAEIRHHQIDAELEMALTKLKSSKAELQRYFKATQKDLKNQRKSRQGLMQEITKLTTAICDETKSLEEKQILQQSLTMMTQLLKNSGEDSTKILTQLAQTTQASLSVRSETQALLIDHSN